MPNGYYCSPGRTLQYYRKRATGLSLRMRFEGMRARSIYFLTLTFDNDHLPDIQDKLSVTREMQLFIKRFRKNLYQLYGKDKKFKYFICSEHGTKGTCRLHFHALIFCDFDCPTYASKVAFRNIVKKSWYKGCRFSCEWKIRDRNKIASYVSGYILKSTLDYCASEVQCWSHGLGDNFVHDNILNYLKFRTVEFSINGNKMHIDIPACTTIKLDGFTYALPQYYYNKFFPSASSQFITAARCCCPEFNIKSIKDLRNYMYMDESGVLLNIMYDYSKLSSLKLMFNECSYKVELMRHGVDPLDAAAVCNFIKDYSHRYDLQIQDAYNKKLAQMSQKKISKLVNF